MYLLTVLDEVGSQGGEAPPGPAVMKTRSLPAWVRSKSRPLSTEDDLAELYAKVTMMICSNLYGAGLNCNVCCFRMICNTRCVQLVTDEVRVFKP